MNTISQHIPDLNALNDFYKFAERERYKIIKKHNVKSLKVESYKVVGRKTADFIDENGIPYTRVIAEGVRRPKFNTNNYTKLLQKFFLYAYGFESRRISSEGRWRPDGKGGGKFIKGLNVGIEDLQVYLPDGRLLAVEVKSPTDRQSEAQRERQQLLGEWYVIATADWAAFTEVVIKRIGEPKNIFWKSFVLTK